MASVPVRDTLANLLTDAALAAQTSGDLPAFEIESAYLERPADASHGEWSSTLAMRAAKAARRPPRAIAEAIVSHLGESDVVDAVEVAGPGFINFKLSPASRASVVAEARELGADFGRSDVGHGQSVQVEFISANPVGPMHLGHGRWAALGDSLCRVFRHTNFAVEPEFYVNDHGSQLDVFGASIAERYLQLASLMRDEGLDLASATERLLADREAYVEDEDDEHPETHPLMSAFNEHLGGNAYGGDYVVELAASFIETDGLQWADQPADERNLAFRERGYQKMLEDMEKTCADVRCTFDVWFSERSLYAVDADGTSQVSRAFDKLREMGYLYEAEGALWFRSTELGDDKDRVLVKANGEYTYFASDVAYHWNKFQRVDHVIDIWGADHHGYIARVRAACDALGYEGRFEVLLGQFVNLLRNGVPVRMSKRKGTMITFRELIDEVGADATRFTLMSRSSNQTIDFDIEKVKQKSADNPVYYVQYAHARICSVLRRAAARKGVEDAEHLTADEAANVAMAGEPDLSLLAGEEEAELCRKLDEFGDLIAGCARDRAPFRITHYLQELAAAYHGFYTACPILPREGRPLDEELSQARLAASDAVRITLAVGLSLIGVSAPESM